MDITTWLKPSCKVRMNGNITESDDIAPFNLRVCVTKGLGEACCRFTNDSELLEYGSLMEFAGQESCSIQACQKGLNHVTGIKDVL